MARRAAPTTLVLALAAALAAPAGLAGCPGPRAPAAVRPLPAGAYGHYLRGKVAMVEGDYPLAAAELRAAAEAAPAEPRIEVARVRALARAGRRHDALVAITAAERRWPDAAEVWRAAGDLWRATREDGAARAAYQRAVALDRTDEPAYLGLAATYLALRRPDDAERTWRDLLRHVPGSIEGHYRLAARLIDEGRLGEAEPHLRAVLEVDPDHVDARLDLARVLRAGGRLDAAIAETRRAFDRTGGAIDVGEELFWLLLEAGDRDGAVDLLGLYDDPEAGLDARLAASRLYLVIDEPALARREAEAALALAPSSGEAQVALARALRAAGDADAALARAEAVPATSPAFADARALAGALALDRGDAARALALVEPARATHPVDARLLLVQARAQRARGRLDDARAAIAAAVRLRPDDAAVLYAWAQLEREAGQRAQALAVIDRLLAAHPDHVDALNFAGFELADRGDDLARAEQLLARARRLAPGDPQILDSWAWLRHRQGKDREAAAALARAVHDAPREPELLLHLGEVEAALGDAALARDALERARALAPAPALARRIAARLASLPAAP